MANPTEDKLVELYSSLKTLRLMYTRLELDRHKHPTKAESNQLAKIDVILPKTARYIITNLNRSIQNDQDR